jgi:hypothetical protein
MKRMSVLFALLVPFALFSNPAAGQESDEDLAKFVRSKWEERYGKIKSVEFTLKIKESIEKGFFSSFPGRRLPGINPHHYPHLIRIASAPRRHSSRV